MTLSDLFVHKDTKKPVPLPAALLNIGILLSILSATITFAFVSLNYHFNWDGILKYKYLFIYGWLTTVAISMVALLISLFIGLIAALAQKSIILPIYYTSRFYIELIRNTPLLVQILIFFYIIAASISLNNRYLIGILTLAFFSGAYVAEIIRAGLESISESQLESARSIGLTSYQTYRYVLIPQILKRILPGLAGQFVSLIKDSSLLSIIAIREFTLNAQQVNSFTYSTIESYIPLAIGYFVLTFPISYLSRVLEKKASYES